MRKALGMRVMRTGNDERRTHRRSLSKVPEVRHLFPAQCGQASGESALGNPCKQHYAGMDVLVPPICGRQHVIHGAHQT